MSGTIGVIVLSLGLLLGLTTAQSSSLPNTPWRLLSNIIGWTYFSAWSISFWPQILLNFQRGTVAGLSFEFLALNLLGFTCYTVYNGGLYWNPTIQAQYFAKTRKTSIPVESNDVFFGLHAVAVTLLTIIQCFTLKREAGQRLSLKWGLVTLGLCVFIAVYAAVVASGRGSSNTWLGGDNAWWTFALNISYVKLAISCCKYIPQVVINHRRRSTAGWSIHNVLLDFTGGLLSVVQQCGDAQATGDWAGMCVLCGGVGIFSFYDGCPTQKMLIGGPLCCALSPHFLLSTHTLPTNHPHTLLPPTQCG